MAFSYIVRLMVFEWRDISKEKDPTTTMLIRGKPRLTMLSYTSDDLIEFSIENIRSVYLQRLKTSLTHIFIHVTCIHLIS